MKAKLKLHILCKLSLYICLNVDTKAKIPQKMNRIACIFGRDTRGIDLTKNVTTQSVFKMFA